MPLEQYRKLLPAIRMTAAALRREAEYVARKNTTEAQRLRLAGSKNVIVVTNLWFLVAGATLGRLDSAQPYLRRILRTYPRSFFASYARRLINQYEAYADREV